MSLLTIIGDSMGLVTVYSSNFIKYYATVEKAKIMSMKILLSIEELTPAQFKTIVAKFRSYLRHIVNMVIEKHIGIFSIINLDYQSKCLLYVEDIIHMSHNLLQSVIEKKNANILEVSILKSLIA